LFHSASRPTRLPRPALIVAAFVAAAVLYSLAAVTGPQPALGLSIRAAACDGVALRTKPYTSATRKAVLSEGTRTTAIEHVTGGSWRATCNGRTVSGNTWFRINTVSGTSVLSRYGVRYVYAATGLFKLVYSTRYAACDTSLRARWYTSSTRKAIIPKGARITIAASISGGSWRTTCAGRTVSGSTWYRISAVNGTSVKSRYGVTYLYAATGTFTMTAPSGSTTAPPPSTNGPTLTEGIDVSHWQGTIDWSRVRASGKRFAYIKASESTSFVDDRYAINRSRAKAAGVLVGAYHFARPDGSSGDAVAEADHFIRTAAPVKGELIPVLDLEVSGGLSDAALASWAKTFLDRVHARTGVRGAIYDSPSIWRNYAGDSNILAVNGYKVLWIAHWTTASSPSLPADNWGNNGWTFWQYTSDGTVSGISGRVDLNRYKGTDFSKVLIP
jgi:GH25 family lysozyme M1 (1,4-beta-N-acetylmuramidase)